MLVNSTHNAQNDDNKANGDAEAKQFHKDQRSEKNGLKERTKDTTVIEKVENGNHSGTSKDPPTQGEMAFAKAQTKMNNVQQIKKGTDVNGEGYNNSSNLRRRKKNGQTQQPKQLFLFEDFHQSIEFARADVNNLSSAVSVASGYSKDRKYQNQLSEEEAEYWSPHTNFFADSPYYDAFIEKELHSTKLLSETVNDISSKTETLQEAGVSLCNAMRSLALSCQLNFTDDPSPLVELKRDALGPNMASALGNMGEVLSKMATAQEAMFHEFNTTFGNLKEMMTKQIQAGELLKKEAKTKTETAEQTFHTYLLGKESYDKKNSHQVLQSSLQKIRVEQSGGELERFKFVRNIVDCRYNRTYELSQSVENLFHKLQTTNVFCSDLLNGLVPIIDNDVGECLKLRNNYETNDKPVWLEREKRILQKWEQETFHKSRMDYANDHTSNNSGNHQINQERMEKKARIWDLPTELASALRFSRSTPSGVIVEGWLYEQNIATFSYSVSWNRRWFILRHDGIFCLHSGDNDLRGSGKWDSAVKRKICDVVLCTIREFPSTASSSALLSPKANTTPRFSFELIITNQKPILLQARGPQDLRMWVDGIQSAIADQLAKGNHDSAELNKNIGRNKRCSEIGSTIINRKMSIFQSGVDIRAMSNLDSSTGELFDSDTEDGHSNNHQKQLIKKVMSENPTCADCGKDSPDWVSLNLGILVCLECSGVHRSLGVHVSQVRSLTLDSLSDSEASVFLELGNERMNRIFERKINASGKKHGIYKKPNSKCSRDEREEWIRKKYAAKEFLGVDNLIDSKRIEIASKLLHKGAERADVLGIAQFIAYGGVVDWVNKDNGNKTALMICVDFMKGQKNTDGKASICAKLLLQNGASVDKLDPAQKELLRLQT